MALIIGPLSGCRKESSGNISISETADISNDTHTFQGVISRETWRQHPEWISRNYDLQGRPKIPHRVYYDYFRFRRQKAQRELAARQADSLQGIYADQHITADARSIDDTVIEVQRTFTGYRPESAEDTSEEHLFRY